MPGRPRSTGRQHHSLTDGDGILLAYLRTGESLNDFVTAGLPSEAHQDREGGQM